MGKLAKRGREDFHCPPLELLKRERDSSAAERTDRTEKNHGQEEGCSGRGAGVVKWGGGRRVKGLGDCAYWRAEGALRAMLTPVVMQKTLLWVLAPVSDSNKSFKY